MEYNDMTLLVLAGGRSRRMGQDKRRISWRGSDFLQDLLRRAQPYPFQEIFVSFAAPSAYSRAVEQNWPVRIVYDQHKDCGPMEGLYQGLVAAHTSYLLVLSCDLPFFDFTRLEPLWQAAVSQGIGVPLAMGHVQPLAAIYSTKMTDVFRQARNDKVRKIIMVLQELSINPVPIEVCDFRFFNVNTPADLQLARGRELNKNRAVPIVSITASHSGLGKTTLIERLLPLLRQQGLQVGVVKSDGHGCDMDREGKDSWRFSQAGASAVAVVSPGGYVVLQQTAAKADLLQVANLLHGVDLILIESRAHGVAPVLEIVDSRKDAAVLTPAADLAAVIIQAGRTPSQVRQLNPDNMEDILNVVLLLSSV